MTLADSPHDETAVTLRAVVHGRVQGVGFRYYVLEEAETLGINGMVRNLPDGTVEVEAKAPMAVLEHLVGRLQEGPRFSRVDDLQVQWGVPIGYRDGFQILP